MFDKVKDRKKDITLLVIGILTLVSLVVGATYAFFKAQTGPAANFDVSTTTGTTDNLSFTTVGNILINASADNFAKGSEDLNGTITATANLIANNSTNTTEKYYYNVYLEVIENELEYSSFTDPEKEYEDLVFTTEYEKTLGNNRDYNGLTKGYEPIPELYLTITGPEGYEYKIDLPKATLQNDDDSYDITELREGIYPLVLNKAIQVEELDNGTKREDWKVKVTLKNLDSNQQLNTGKTFNAKVIIQAEKIPMNLMDVCSEGGLLADCIQQLHDKSTYGASNLIYHDGKADYEDEENYTLEAEDNSYRYTGSYEKVNNYICFGEKCSTDPSDSDYDNLYRIVGTFGDDGIKLVKADYANKELLGVGTQKPENLNDLDNIDTTKYGSYVDTIYKEKTVIAMYKEIFFHRYKGMYDYFDRYRWQEIGTTETQANWSTSLLNIIHLNINYYNKIKQPYQELIKNHTWIWENDNSTWNNIAVGINAKTVYDNELGENSTNQQTDPENIGLLYVSDYLYGASPNNWSKKSYTAINGYTIDGIKKDKFGNLIGSYPEHTIDADYRSATDNNWLYIGFDENLITIDTLWKHTQNIMAASYFITYGGNNNTSYVGAGEGTIRPTFYITNDTKLISGTGTFEDPYIISQ